jgi:hypothetical protein
VEQAGTAASMLRLRPACMGGKCCALCSLHDMRQYHRRCVPHLANVYLRVVQLRCTLPSLLAVDGCFWGLAIVLLPLQVLLLRIQVVLALRFGSCCACTCMRCCCCRSCCVMRGVARRLHLAAQLTSNKCCTYVLQQLVAMLDLAC